MAKTKSAYFCQSCGVQSAKWIGKCPSCNGWNTYVEEIIQQTESPHSYTTSTIKKRIPKPILIGDITVMEQERIFMPDNEFNRVLGGGIVPGSLILFGGEPGIGKSTLMLQIALNLLYKKTLYVSGEESEQQIRMRAERIGIINQ